MGLRAVRKHDIGRLCIVVMNAVFLKRTQQCVDILPVALEFFPAFVVPLFPSALFEFRRGVQPGLCEVQNKWRRDNPHFDNPQRIIMLDELRNGKALYFRHSRGRKPPVALKFGPVPLFAFECFDRWFPVTFPDAAIGPVPERAFQIEYNFAYRVQFCITWRTLRHVLEGAIRTWANAG